METHITDSRCKKALKEQHPSLGRDLHFFHKFFVWLSVYLLLPMMYRQIQRQSIHIIILHVFMLHSVYWIPSCPLADQDCRLCPHYITGRADRMWAVDSTDATTYLHHGRQSQPLPTSKKSHIPLPHKHVWIHKKNCRLSAWWPALWFICVFLQQCYNNLRKQNILMVFSLYYETQRLYNPQN
jgi:hypothetical protein